ncbi:MAG: hypothetical protein AABY22_34200 [Nanoarchaeota archaeon]
MKNNLNTKLPIHLCKKYKTEQLFGVPPNSLHNSYTVYKSSKKGQKSFRITKSLLENILKTSKKINKAHNLIITIEDDCDMYYIDCKINKTTKEKS